MEFHDPDRVQIILDDEATNETTVVYTVPAGKKFYLIESTLHVTAGAVGFAEVRIRNDSDVIQRHTNSIFITILQVAPADHFCPNWPIELPAGWDIAVISSVAGLTVECDIFGYETNA